MSFKINFFNIFKSLNPYNYIELANVRISGVFKYFFFVIVLCLSILFIIGIPYVYHTDKYVTSGVSHFDALSFSSNIQIKDSFNVFTDPLVRVDSNNGTNNTLKDEVLLVTPKNIVYKKYLFFGSEKVIPINTNVDIVNSPNAKRIVILGVFFLLPSIIFWITMFWIVYFFAVILFTYVLVLMASGSLRIDASAVHLFKLSIYSSTILVISQIALIPIYTTMVIPVAVYWLFIMFVIFLWYDNPPGRGARKAGDNSGNYVSSDSGSKSKSIFGDSGNSSKGTFSNRTPKADEYDVDENGNARGSGKRHKSVDDENDGYVQM